MPDVLQQVRQWNRPPILQRLLPAVRAAGIQVFVVPHHRSRPDDFAKWMYVNPIQVQSKATQSFAVDTWSGECHPEFGPKPGDVVGLETSKRNSSNTAFKRSFSSALSPTPVWRRQRVSAWNWVSTSPPSRPGKPQHLPSGRPGNPLSEKGSQLAQSVFDGWWVRHFSWQLWWKTIISAGLAGSVLFVLALYMSVSRPITHFARFICGYMGLVFSAVSLGSGAWVLIESIWTQSHIFAKLSKLFASFLAWFRQPIHL